MTSGFQKFDAQTFASQGNAILGIRDSGKTVTAIGFAEELFKAGIPFTAFDPIGRWHFIRTPGKGRGYPVVVAGGTAGDLPLNVESAPAIVKAAMESGISLVIDLYDMALSKADWKRIVGDCVRLLLYENGRFGLRHIFLEEASEFAPQRVGPDQGKVYAEIEKLARMGGNARLGYTLINQRAEEVNKAVLELCDNLFLHRQKGRNSLNALSKWLDIADVKAGKAIISTLPTLPQGECWAWMAGTDQPVHVKVPMNNSFAPDRRAMGKQEGATAKKVDVGNFVQTMLELLQHPKKPDVERHDAAPSIVKTSDGEKSIVPIATIEAVQKQSWKEEHNAGYTAGFYAGAKAVREELLQSVIKVFEAAQDARNMFSHELPKPSGALLNTKIQQLSPASKLNGHDTHQKYARSEGGAELRILRVLASRHPAKFTKAQWAVLSNMKRSGGTWNTYVSRLRTSGYIIEEGNLVGVAEAGFKAIGGVPQPIVPSAIITQWKESLGSGPAKMIDALIHSHPQPMDRANLADRVHMQVKGGTFNTYISRLKTNGLIQVHKRKISIVPLMELAQ